MEVFLRAIAVMVVSLGVCGLADRLMLWWAERQRGNDVRRETQTYRCVETTFTKQGLVLRLKKIDSDLVKEYSFLSDHVDWHKLVELKPQGIIRLHSRTICRDNTSAVEEYLRVAD